jgi:CheY-like chemotaxis protein
MLPCGCCSKWREAVGNQENSYDIIFMDIPMPEMDGITASKIMKNVRKEFVQNYCDDSQRNEGR